MDDKGFHQNGYEIEDFTAECGKCKSNNIEIKFEFNYYGGMTGWDSSLQIECNNCGNTTNLDA